MIGARIKERRKAAHMTQKELGDAVGFVKTTVCSWEKDKFKPDVDTIERIAEVLHTSARYLLGYSDDPNLPLLDWRQVEDGKYQGIDVDTWFKNRSRLPENLEMLPSTHSIPLLGSIACGDPITAEENVEGYVDAPVEKKCHFALRCKGDSMINARIMDGDIVFIRQQDTVNDGEIAAVLIDDEATLKRVHFLPQGMLMLQAENPKYQPIIIGGADETRNVRILGKAVAFQSDIR